MSRPRQTGIRLVGENSEVNSVVPSSLAGIRRLADGSLQYRASSSDSRELWLPLASPIRVVALTRDSENHNWGRLLEVQDADGNRHRWAMPATLLATARCDECRQTLLSLGAQLANTPGAVNALHRYLSATIDFEGRTLPRATAATRLGWHGKCFVLPDRALGGTNEVVYQSTSQIRPAMRRSGTLENWQERVAKPAVGNSRVVLALSAAVAAPLLGPF